MQLHKLLHKLQKKGEWNWKVIMLIVVLIGVIVLFLIWGLMSGMFGEEALDTACAFFSVTRLTATGPGGGRYAILPDRCVSRAEDIYPTKWSKCDPKFKEDPSRCAAQQIADLVVRCWNMRGKGESDPSDLECFKACVHQCKGYPKCEDFKVTESMIEDVIKTTNMTGTDELYSKFYKPKDIRWHEWRLEELYYPEERRNAIRMGETWAILFLDDWTVLKGPAGVILPGVGISTDRISVNYKFPCYD